MTVRRGLNRWLNLFKLQVRQPVPHTRFVLPWPLQKQTLSRRAALSLPWALAPVLAGASGPQWTLLSHRGVYSRSVAENTGAAAEEAIRRGYWMMETDLRRSADGRIVIQHDSSFKRICGVNRKVSEMTWPEIRSLRSEPGGERPLEFAEMAAIARGRIGLWLDIKEQTADQQFLAEIEATLRENRLLDNAIIGINPVATPFFRGRVTTAATVQTLFYEPARQDLAKDTVLVEGLGFTLSDESVRWGLERNFRVIPFVGTSQYPGVDGVAPGTAVIKRLQSAGVTTFMIDSVFEPLFRGFPAKPSTQPKKEQL